MFQGVYSHCRERIHPFLIMRNKAHPYGGAASPSLLLEEKVARQSRDGCGGKVSSQDMLNKCDDRTVPLYLQVYKCKCKGVLHMKKLDKLGVVLNIVLGVFYLPFSFFCFILLMMSEATIGATNPIYICMIDIFCFVEFFIPLLCLVGIALSIWFRKKGYSVLSFVIQFLPLFIFALNLAFGFVTDFIPKTI